MLAMKQEAAVADPGGANPAMPPPLGAMAGLAIIIL